MLLGQGALAVLAVLVVLKSYHSWQANRWNKENQWQSRSWVDDEGLGFSRERSKSLINPPTNTANEISKAIALRYPKWLCREYLPFLQLKQEFSGRSHLCLPVLGTKLLSFSPLKEESCATPHGRHHCELLSLRLEKGADTNTELKVAYWQTSRFQGHCRLSSLQA